MTSLVVVAAAMQWDGVEYPVAQLVPNVAAGGARPRHYHTGTQSKLTRLIFVLKNPYCYTDFLNVVRDLVMAVQIPV